MTRKIIADNHKPPLTDLTPAQYEITRQLQRLDHVAANNEALWGMGFIEEVLKEKFPELAAKWDKQKAKLNKAIQENNSFEMGELVDGSIKAYKLFDEKIREAGYNPRHPAYWSVGVDGVSYIVVNNLLDAKALHRPPDKDTVGCVILTLEELIRVYHARATIKPNDKVGMDFAAKAKQFDWKIGDTITI